jgi:hypothetical protein
VVLGLRDLSFLGKTGALKDTDRPDTGATFLANLPVVCTRALTGAFFVLEVLTTGLLGEVVFELVFWDAGFRPAGFELVFEAVVCVETLLATLGLLDLMVVFSTILPPLLDFRIRSDFPGLDFFLVFTCVGVSTLRTFVPTTGTITSNGFTTSILQ